jgi:uncharacterized PurR-regulated membrane protein YhhQ (DUF165 family)
MGTFIAVAMAYFAWDTVTEYRARNTSGWFLGSGFVMGVLSTVLLGFASYLKKNKPPSFGDGLVRPLSVPLILFILAVPNVLPDLLCALFSFGTDGSIRHQARGAIFLGAFVTFVPFIFLSRRMYFADNPKPDASI